jgi:hypothetical protein
MDTRRGGGLVRLGNEAICVGIDASLPDQRDLFLVRCMFVGDTLSDLSRDQNWLLRDKPELGAQSLCVQILDIGSIEFDHTDIRS